MNELCRHVGHLRAVRVRLDKGQRGGQNPVRLAAVTTDCRDRYLGNLSAIELTYLGGGDLQLLAQPAQQSADDLTLEFQRVRRRQVKDHSDQTNCHAGGGHHDLFLTISVDYS